MKLLEAFGFVEIRPSGDQKFGLAFLPNPNVALLRLWALKEDPALPGPRPPGLAGLQANTISAFLERAIDVSANDVAEEQARRTAAKVASAAPAKPAKRTPRPRAAKAGGGGTP